VKQLKQLKENLQYMQMNTSSEINTERLNYLETEVSKIRSAISEEHHYGQVLKHMYQTRLDSFMALQKPLNAIRRSLMLVGFKEHELEQNLLTKTNSLKHVQNSVNRADTRFDDQQLTHTAPIRAA